MTTVAIHQPNFFPWIGYFDKIANCDYFVFLDGVQFTNGSMINRTKIYHRDTGEKYLTCPVTAPYQTKIKDITIPHRRWSTKAHRTVMWNYQDKFFYKDYIFDIGLMLFYDERNLSKYNIRNIMQMCSLLGVHPREGFLIQSELDIRGEYKSTDLLVNIIGYLGGNEYYSGTGGKNYLDEKMMSDAGINITYQDIQTFPPTSIIDVLMKRGKSGVLELLH